MVSASDIERALDDAGYRITAPRRSLAAIVAAQPGHFTAEVLLAESRRRRSGLSRATIFRSIDALTRVGVVERIDMPSGEHVLVACEPRHHHHVTCSSCGRTAPVPDCGVGSLAAQLARRTGYRIDTHRVEIFGLCPTCQQSSPD